MKALPESERPYERCVKYGASNLTDAELIAILIKSGTSNMSSLDIARKLLADDIASFKGVNKLKIMQYPDYVKYEGIGKVKAVTLMAAVELGKRISLSEIKDSVKYDSPSTVASYYMEEMSPYQTEHFYMLALDSKNRLKKRIEISKGTVNQTLASPRECMIEALKYDAVSFIIIHNHPSGDPTPSANDFIITRRMKEAGELLDIRLIDHIIIGDHTYYSMKEENDII